MISTDFIADMLQHVPHQEHLLRRFVDPADERDFAAIVCFDVFCVIAGIDPNAPPSQPEIQQLAGEHA